MGEGAVTGTQPRAVAVPGPAKNWRKEVKQNTLLKFHFIYLVQQIQTVSLLKCLSCIFSNFILQN